MQEVEFEQDFVKDHVLYDQHSIMYTLNQIAEVHSADYGWEIGSPTIVPNPDGKTCTITVHLTKYAVQSQGPRTR